MTKLKTILYFACDHPIITSTFLFAIILIAVLGYSIIRSDICNPMYIDWRYPTTLVNRSVPDWCFK